jgi:hypothetical protein
VDEDVGGERAPRRVGRRATRFIALPVIAVCEPRAAADRGRSATSSRQPSPGRPTPRWRAIWDRYHPTTGTSCAAGVIGSEKTLTIGQGFSVTDRAPGVTRSAHPPEKSAPELLDTSCDSV